MPVLSSLPMLADAAETLRLIFIAIGLTGIAVLIEGRLYGVTRLPHWLLYGVGYGLLGLAAMQFPITGLFGVPVDMRAPVLAMAILLGGPKALLLAGAMLLAYRWGLGGTFVVIGLLTIVSSMAITILFWAAWFRRRRAGWPTLSLLGVTLAIGNSMMAASWSDPLNYIVTSYLLLLIPIYPASLVLLSFAVNEVRYHRNLVVGRQAMEQRLSKALAEAEAASRARSRLLATASHDLRTPMNAIMGYTGAMRAGIWGPLKPDRYQEYLQDIERASDQLLHLIDQWIEVARNTGDDWAPKPTPVSLDDLIEDVLVTLRPTATEQEVTVTACVVDDPGPVLLDRGAVRQILSNLVGNGVKYTPPGGEVRLKAQWASGQVHFSVTDTGLGLPAGLAETASTPFVRGDNTGDVPGWGLGLAIVGEIVHKLGGQVQLSNQSTGGVLAKVTLPTSLATADAIKLSSSANETGPKKLGGHSQAS